MIGARVASARDISAATEVLTVAYIENPLITWYFPDTDRQDRTRELFRLLLERAVPNGSVYIDADVRGCAIWTEPTSEPVAARFPQTYVGDRRGQVFAGEGPPLVGMWRPRPRSVPLAN